MKRLVLLGGGHAHVHCLAAFAAQPLEDVEITLISPYARQVYSGMLPGWVAGHYDIEACVIPLPPLAARAGIRFLQTRATAIDADNHVVTCADGSTHAYDTLSVDIGTVFDADAIPGAGPHGLLVRPIEEFIVGWGAERQRLAALTAPRITMVGGGAAGIELLLAMHHAMPTARCTLISAANTLPGKVGPRLAGILQSRQITLRGNTAATRIAPGQVELVTGERVETDLAVIAIGATSGFTLPAPTLARDPRGFALVNDYLQSVSHPRIFAAGDCATMRDHPRPKSGVHAVRAGPPLAANLRLALAGQPLLPHIPQQRSLYLISTGDRYAIGSWGDWSWQGAWVWRWKDRIDRAFVQKYQPLADG